jgi:hypothetical protein
VATGGDGSRQCRDSVHDGERADGNGHDRWEGYHRRGDEPQVATPHRPEPPPDNDAEGDAEHDGGDA